MDPILAEMVWSSEWVVAHHWQVAQVKWRVLVLAPKREPNSACNRICEMLGTGAKRSAIGALVTEQKPCPVSVVLSISTC
eukprot:1160914-Pelagomonas_calceolata.AAC.12